MAQESALSLQLFASGYCIADSSIVSPKNAHGKSRFYAVWGLLHIPNTGYVVFDTGYNNQFNTATKKFPDRLYRWITPVTIDHKNAAKSILESNGISINEIKYVIISHFHADHICSLKDFTNAQFICHDDAYEEFLRFSGWSAVRKGILHKLFPADFKEKVKLLKTFADTIEINKYGLTEFSLFGISQFKLVLIPGHAKGMLGFIYNHNEKCILYATDASWSYINYYKGILPSKIVKLFFDSWDDFIETQKKIKSFELDNSQYKILFTHCPITLKYVDNEF